MPELPEVETIRRQLSDVLVGQTITDTEVKKKKSFQGEPKSVIGYQITGTRRFGKALVIDLVNPKTPKKKNNKTDEHSNLSLVIHLKMTGQLIYEPHGIGGTSHASHRIAGGHPTKDFTSKLPSSHTRVIIFLAQQIETKSKLEKEKVVGATIPFDSSSLRSGKNNQLPKNGVLYFNDQRIFGWIKLVPTAQVEQLPFIKKLGPEPDQITFDQFYKLLQTSKKAVKVRIMDQDKLAGVGNIYANDALWVAKIHPEIPANQLTQAQAKELLSAIQQVIEEGIKYGGATAADGGFIDLQGLGGHYQEYFKVYQREEESCLRSKCNATIKKAKIGGRGTYYCPQCQEHTTHS